MAGERFRVIARNQVDSARLSSSVATLAGTSVENLKNDRRARVARWDDAALVSVYGDWNGGGAYVSGFCADRLNAEPAATVRFRGWPTADRSGGTSIDTGTVPPYIAPALGDLLFGVTPLGGDFWQGFGGYRYWTPYFARSLIASFQFDISDTNSAGYIEVGRLILGDYFEPAANADYGLRLGWRENTEQEEMDGGSLPSDGRVPRRAATGTFSDLSEAERSAWFEITGYVGKRKPFLASFQPGAGGKLERDFTIPRAKFDQLPDLSWDYPTGHALPFSILEA